MTTPTPTPLPDWPALLEAELAAAYLGEKSVVAFRSRVGTVYPRPIDMPGRRQVWARVTLDQTIAAHIAQGRPSPSLADDV